MTKLEKELKEICDVDRIVSITMYSKGHRNDINSHFVGIGKDIRFVTNFVEGFVLRFSNSRLEILNADKYVLKKVKDDLFEVVDKYDEFEILLFISIWSEKETKILLQYEI